jgi:hypothetical protein
MRSFQSSGLVHAAGIATSLINSGHQWLEIYFYLSLYQELINVNIVVTKPYYLKPLWHNFVYQPFTNIRRTTVFMQILYDLIKILKPGTFQMAGLHFNT